MVKIEAAITEVEKNIARLEGSLAEDEIWVAQHRNTIGMIEWEKARLAALHDRMNHPTGNEFLDALGI